MKSVAGISFDFMIYNWLGFLCYSVFNLGLYLHPHIRQEYRYRPRLLHLTCLAVPPGKRVNRAAKSASWSKVLMRHMSEWLIANVYTCQHCPFISLCYCCR